MPRIGRLPAAIAIVCHLSAGAARPQEPLVDAAFMLPAGTRHSSVVEVVRLVVDERTGRWTVDAVERVDVRDGVVRQGGLSGRRYAVVLRLADGDLRIREPFYWPAHPSAYWVDDVPLRSVQVGFRPPLEHDPAWIGPQGPDASRSLPVCAQVSSDDVECFGLRPGERGVLLGQTRSPVRFAFIDAPAASDQTVRVIEERAEWGRLLIIRPTDRDPVREEELRVTLQRRLDDILHVRHDLTAFTETREASARSIGTGSVWLSGATPTDGLSVKIEGPGAAPARIELAECCVGPPDVPVEIALGPSRTLTVRVATGAGVAAPETLLTLLSVPTDEREDAAAIPVRREVVAEGWTDEQGEWDVEVLPGASYDVRATHASHGQAQARVAVDDRRVAVRFSSPSQVSGRVVRLGEPAAGVPIRVVPDLNRLTAGPDPFSAVAPGLSTGDDGRFTVAVPRAGGQILIGDPAWSGQVRIPLGPASGSGVTIDLGDIVLESGYVLEVQVESPAGCEVMAAGPLGVAGLTAVASVRVSPGLHRLSVPEPGRWWVSLICEGREVAVDPQTVEVEAVSFPQRVHVYPSARP